MAKVRLDDIPYLRQTSSGCYWEPSRRVRKLGFAPEALGKDVIKAAGRAQELNRQVDAVLKAGPGALKAREIEGTVAWAIQRYKASSAWKELEASTQVGYQKWLNRIEEWCGDKRIEAVTRKAIKAWQEEMETVSPSSAASTLRVFRVVMHFTRDRGYKIDNFDKLHLHTGGGEGEPWEDYEISAYVDQAIAIGRRSMALAAMLAVCLGQREGDVIALPRTRYNAAAEFRTSSGLVLRGEFEIKQHKTGKRLRIPVLPELRREIEMMPLTGVQLVINETIGRPYTDKNFRRIHRAICREAGIADNRHFMHFRHTAATRLGDAGCSEDLIKAITGHDSDAVKRYVRPTDTMAKAAIDKLVEFRGKR